MDLSQDNELSAFITSVEVISPTPTPPSPPVRNLDDDEVTPYIEDYDLRIYVPPPDVAYGYTQDLSLGSPQTLDSPSSTYYSARSDITDMSPRSAAATSPAVLSINPAPEQHTEYLYNPADHDIPSTSSLLIYREDDYIPQSSTLFTPKLRLDVSGCPEFSPASQVSPGPLSPLFLATPHSHSTATPPSNMFDDETEPARLPSNTIQLTQLGSGVAVLTPSDPRQQIPETGQWEHKGSPQEWCGDTQLFSSTAQNTSSPVPKDWFITLSQTPESDDNHSTDLRSSFPMVVDAISSLSALPNSTNNLDTLRAVQSTEPQCDLAAVKQSTEGLGISMPSKSPSNATTPNILDAQVAQQTETILQQPPSSILLHPGHSKQRSRSNSLAHVVLLPNDHSSPMSNAEQIHRPSGIIHGRGGKESRVPKHRPTPYPMDARQARKYPNTPPLSPSLSSASIPIQAHKLFAAISSIETSGGSKLQEEIVSHFAGFPDRLRFLVSQIARIKELRKKFTLSLAVPEKRADAQAISDYLNIILHEGDIIQTDDGPKLLRLLYKLAEAAQIYPTRLLLKGVEMASQPFEGGSFADVFKGKHNDEEVCVKVIRIFQSRGQAQVLKAYVREIILWSHMSHENILPFYGLYALDESAQRICLVSPLMRNGNLRVYLQNNPSTPRLPLVLDIIEGLSYLHRSNIIHGDLKAQNILVSNDRRALITDFGLSFIAMATTAGSTELDSAGTTNWMAPELILTENHDEKPTKESDIWSFGCLCYEIYTGNYPFHQYKYRGQVMFAHIRGEIPVRPIAEDLVCDQLEDWMWDPIMSGCWKKDPQERVSCRVIRDILAKNAMQDSRCNDCNWDERKSAFWQAMRDRSENQVNFRQVEDILGNFLKTHEQSTTVAGPSSLNV